MIMRTKNKKLFLFVIPIRTKTTEYRRSIIQSVRQHAEFHVGIRNDMALIEHEIWQRHDFTSTLQKSGSVYHTDRFGSRTTLDLKRQQAHKSDERRSKIERHAVANLLK